MHALAITLSEQGYQVTGSDDEIYDPSLSRLKAAGLAPQSIGWDAQRVADADLVIVGMHARADNPELLAAQERGIPIHSFPSYIADLSKNKKQVVITGSHGKTTTTAMIMQALRSQGVDFDYLVGADISGFDSMVKLTDAPLIIIEGDEYLSSPIDRRPKFSHFDPDVTVMTGIAWDHINVFPTEESYDQQFENYVDGLSEEAYLVYYLRDEKVRRIAASHGRNLGYHALRRIGDSQVSFEGEVFDISIIGEHNLQNMAAALHVCRHLGMSTQEFFAATKHFSGADRRLEVVAKGEDWTVFYDFAHAPSKVRATTEAVKAWYSDRRLIACLELHTYSSLNREFIPQYHGVLDGCDVAAVYYSEHTFEIKKMTPLSEEEVQSAFGREDLHVFTSQEALAKFLKQQQAKAANLLLMSSGRFDGMQIDQLWT